MQVALRLSLLLAAFVFSVASASSTSNAPPSAPASVANPVATPPPSQPMDPSAALGLWKTSFGPVKIDSDPGRAGGLLGVWLYDRDNQEVIGSFAGTTDGNVFNFSWQEPSAGAPLRGTGYLVFDPAGGSFTGRWWTDNQDRGGDWNGWRAPSAEPEQVQNFGDDQNQVEVESEPYDSGSEIYDPSRPQ